MNTEDEKFQWTDALVDEYVDRCEKESLTIEDFKKEKSNQQSVFNEEKLNKQLDKLVAMEEGFNLGKSGKYKTFMEYQKGQPYKGEGFEILECYNKGSERVHKYLSKEDACAWEQSCDDKGCKINSVRRIEDNTTWTIGDFEKHIGSIKSITYDKNYPLPQDVLLHGEKYENYIVLRYAEKVKEPIPLFTTEDGLKYCGESIQLWYIKPNTWEAIEVHAPNYWSVEELCHSKKEAAEIGNNFTPKYKWFSTEDAAKTYILYNSKSLSLNDVIGQIKRCCDGTYSENMDNWDFVDKPVCAINNLKHKVQTKINGL